MSADGQVRIEIDGDAKGFDKELERAKSSTIGLAGDLEKVGASAASIGKSLTTFVTVPLLTAAGAALKMAGDYDQSMRQIQVITGATAEQMELLRAKTDEVAASTQFSKGDAAKALIELAKGGLDAEASMNALSSVLNLATIGEMGLAESSNVVVQAMNTFKNTGATAESVVTALAGAANASTADVNDLALALSQVGPGAAQAGWSIEETTAVLASFADYGIKGSDAGTSLKTMMTRLVPTTKEAADMMSSLGLSFVDANGNIDDAATVAQKLKEALGSLTPEQQNVALSTLFGQDAMRAATVMMNIGEQGVRDYTQAATDMSSVQEQAAVKTEGFTGAYKRAFNSVKSLAISLGELLAPAASSALNALSDFCSALANSSDATKGLVLGVGAVAAGIPVALYAFGSMTKAVTTSVKAFGEFSQAAKGLDVAANTSAAAAGRLVNALGTAIPARVTAAKTALSELSFSMLATRAKTTLLTAATTIQTAAMTALNAVMSANPLVLIALAIVAVAGALYMLYQHCEPVREVMDAIAGVVKDKLLGVFELFKEKISGMMDVFSELKRRAIEGFSPLVKKIEELKPQFEEVKNKLSGAFSPIKEKFEGLKDKFNELGNKIMELKDLLSEAFAPLREKLQPVMGIFSQIGEKLEELLGGITPLQIIFGIIGLAIAGVLTVISSVLTGVVAFISGFLDALGGVVDFITGAFSAAIGVFTGDFDRVNDGLQSMSDGASAIFSGLYQMTIGTLKGLVDGALSMIGSLVGQAGLSFDNLKNAVISKVSALASSAISKASELASGFISMMSGLPGRVASIFSSLASGAMSALGSMGSRMYSVASDIISGLVSGISNGASRVVNAISNMAGNAISAAKSKLGINSPSRVFKYIGDMSAKGMQVGWENGESAIISSITNTAKRAVEAARTDMIAPTFGDGNAFSSTPSNSGGITCTNNFYSPVTSYGDVLRAQRDASMLMAVM